MISYYPFLAWTMLIIFYTHTHNLHQFSSALHCLCCGKLLYMVQQVSN